MQTTWLTVVDVMHLRGPRGRDDLQSAQRLVRRWFRAHARAAAQHLPAPTVPRVERQSRGVGGVQLVVHEDDLRLYLPGLFRAPRTLRAAA